MPDPILLNGWETIRTAEDLCERLPDRVRSLLEALNLDHAGLEATRACAAEGDLPGYEEGGLYAVLRKQFQERRHALLDAAKGIEVGGAVGLHVHGEANLWCMGLQSRVPKAPEGLFSGLPVLTSLRFLFPSACCILSSFKPAPPRKRSRGPGRP